MGEDDIAERDAAVRDGRYPERLWPLWPLADHSGALWKLLVEDQRVERFAVYGLFPASYDLVYGSESVDVDIRYDGRTRGRVAIITGRLRGQAVGIVIKPCQSPGESEIAGIAGDLGLGPRQLPSIDGFLTEEFVHGPFLTDLTPEEASAERMFSIGRELGFGLSRLHAAGICYNDAIVSDPNGRSHSILSTNGVRLIDFGVALLLRDHPANLTFHDAYNAARTDPMFRLFRRMASEAGPETLGRVIDDYGRRLAQKSVEEIQSRDWRIAEEGVTVVAGMYGSVAAGALWAGIAAGKSADE
jgi:tRNA A-37 threonylcarbamoyl transferase component Bud32